MTLQTAANDLTINGTGPDATISNTLDDAWITLKTNSVADDELASTSVGAGTYGSTTGYPRFTVNDDGRLTFAEIVPLNTVGGAIPVSGTGDVGIGGYANAMTTTILTGAGNNVVTAINDAATTSLINANRLVAPVATLTSDVTVSGALDNMQIDLKSGVVTGVELENLSPSPAGTYGDASHIPIVTVDEYGRVTSVDTSTVTASISLAGDVTGSANANRVERLWGTRLADLGLPEHQPVEEDVLTWRYDTTLGYSHWEPHSKGDIQTSVYFREGTAIDVNGNLNDLPLPNAALVRLTNHGSGFNITGFAGGEDGRIIIIFNDTGVNASLKNQDAGSLAQNQLLIFTNNIIIGAQGVAMFVYVSSIQKWVLIATRS